jgi:hypothetical protein
VTISSTTDRATFIGNGVTVDFSLPFRFFADSDIQASLVDNATFLITPLDLGVDYTLTGAGEPEFNGSPVSELHLLIPAPTSDFSIFVQRVMDLVQPTDIVNQGRFFPDIHETVFDRMTMLIQQAALGPQRAIQVQPFDPIPGLIPGALTRAGKVFGFDPVTGDPVVSSLTLSQIEGQVGIAQGFAQQAGQAATDAQGFASDAEAEKDAAQAIADSLTGAAVPLFSVMWWPERTAIPAGYVAADGQALSRATYPDAWAGIDAGNVPTVADATWNSTPTERGKFTAGDGSTTFRMPDYNGKAAGSLGAVFLRGDGTLSAGTAGVIQQDEIKSHTHGIEVSGTDGNPGVVDSSSSAPTGTVQTLSAGGAETRPLNVTGCWVIKLFGAVVNVGAADAAQLASDYANLAAALQTLDGQIDFTIIYPNGGSAASPANVTANSRYVDANPFAGCQVICVVEIFSNNRWGEPGWYYSSGSSSAGVRASQYQNATDDLIVTQTALNWVTHNGSVAGSPFGENGQITSAPCRVKVWKVKGAGA